MRFANAATRPESSKGGPMRALAILAAALAVAACQPKTEAQAPADPAKQEQSAQSKAYMDKVKAEAGVKVLASGLAYKVVRSGPATGLKPQLTDEVKVHYEGKLINGKVFDQTKPEEAATFMTGRLIPGWVEALKLMKTGDTWEIVVPSELGYGADGAGDSIPPDQTLVFTMTLAKVEYAN